jgi:HD-GYP domain-containing protein (c-di-GMP phosphodiesterase class II)
VDDDDWKIVRAHPEQGAELVGRVEGFEEIAAIILAHHERIDGRGYPSGLRGEQIPSLARIISVADVYDVLTGRDTYRTPVSPTEAIAEMRRVAGTQLDARFVELFATIVERDEIRFGHAEDADFEAELAMEQHIRELAQPRVPA